MEGKPRTILLDDLPSDTDAFGSHEPVATAIGEMVDREEGGKAIALEGSWGSGKSTIISVLSERLKGQVFVFDAWAHEGDPLRRVFLERLIEFCWRKIDHCRWSDTRDELRRRRRVEKSRVLPQLSFAGGLVTLSILAIPIGAALIAVGGAASSALPLDSSTLFYVGLGGVVAAPTLLILHLLFWGLRWVRYALRGGQKPSHALGGISLFVNQTVQESTTETIETPEPSSVEFAKIFTDLLSEYLSQPSDRLVLVVDNLDRMSREQALAIWSTLRIFLEECGRRHDGWRVRVWLLVPYDRPAMETLWAEAGRGSSRPETDEAGPGDRDLQPDVLPASFLAKTFQVRFEVPPLVLADWKAHLLDLQRKAFPDQEEGDEFNGAYRVFRRWCDKRRMAPTPRELVLFVNDVGAIHRRWAGRFPLAHLAYYVILRYQDSTVDLVEGLKDGSVPEESYSDLLTEDVADHLTAIYFSREPDEARHLLMADDIRRALAAGDADELSKLEGHRGFWDLAEDLLPDIGRDWDESPDATANAGIALVGAGFADMAQPVRRNALLQFAEEVTARCDWGILTEDKAKGIASYIAFFGDEAHARRLFDKAVLATQQPDGESSVDLEEAKAASVAFSTVLKALDIGGFSDLYQSDGIGLAGSPDWVVSLGSGFWSDRERSHGYWKWIKVSDEEECQALIEALCPQPDTEAWDRDKVQTISVLASAADAGIDWSSVDEGGLAVLNDVGTEFPPTKIRDVLVSLWGTCGLKHIKAAGDGGQLAHHLNRAIDRESWSAATECAIGMLAFSNVANRPSVGESAQGYTHLDTILGGTAESSLLGEVKSSFKLPRGKRALRAMLKSGTSFGPLFLMAVRDSIENESLGAILSPRLIFDCWEQITQLLPESSDDPSLGADAVLVAANADDVLIGHLEKSKFDVGRVAAYRALLKAIPDAPRLLAWLKESLRGLAEESWQEALTGGSSELIVLAAQVKSIDSTLVLEDPLQDALEQYGRALMDGSASAIEPEDELRSTIGCLPDADKTTLARKLLLAAIAEATPSDPFFSVFGDLLAQEDVLQSEPSLVHALLTPLVNAESPGGIRWIADFTRTFPTLLGSGSYPNDAVGDFRGRIAEKVASGEADESTAEDLRDLAAALGISVDVPDDEDAAEDD